jgi:hypothetical protein
LDDWCRGVWRSYGLLFWGLTRAQYESHVSWYSKSASGLYVLGAIEMSSMVRQVGGAGARAGADAEDRSLGGTAGRIGFGGDTSATVGMLIVTADDDCGN